MKNECSVYRAMDIIGKRWTIILLLELYKGQKAWKRYSEIKRNVPQITPKMLSARLKEMEQEKLIVKRVNSESIPIKSEYSLTKSGLDIIKVIQNMKAWVIKWNPSNKICRNAECKTCTF